MALRLSRLVPTARSERLLALNALVSSIGFGSFNAASAIFFTRSVGLSARQVGLGLSLAGLATLLLSVPLGHLADRRGARELAVALTLTQALLIATYAAVGSFSTFLVVLVAVGAANAGAHVARDALFAGLVEGDDRVRVSAYLRSVLNLGITLGALLAGIAVAVDTRHAYLALVAGNVVTLAGSAVLLSRLPRVPPSPRAADVQMTRALHDRPYVAISVLCGLLRFDQSVLSVALPLWVVSHTSAPRALAAWLIGVNTILVVLFQVRASRGIRTTVDARRAQLRAVVLLATACITIGLAREAGPLVAAGALVGGVVFLSVGELWLSAAEWQLRFDLADPAAQGQYSGVFTLGSSLEDLLGPAVVTSLTATFLLGGWVALAALFGGLGLVAGPTVRWAERTRPRVRAGAAVSSAARR